MESFEEMLDGIEEQVDKLKQDVMRIGEQQETLTRTLQTLLASLKESSESGGSSGHRDQITQQIETLLGRISAMQIFCHIVRTEDQTEAFFKVQQHLNRLQTQIEQLNEQDPAKVKEAQNLAQNYLADCSEGTGSKFEALLLTCSVEDQKFVKKKLTQIVHDLNGKSPH